MLLCNHTKFTKWQHRDLLQPHGAIHASSGDDNHRYLSKEATFSLSSACCLIRIQKLSDKVAWFLEIRLMILYWKKSIFIMYYPVITYTQYIKLIIRQDTLQHQLMNNVKIASFFIIQCLLPLGKSVINY